MLERISSSVVDDGIKVADRKHFVGGYFSANTFSIVVRRTSDMDG
jgi:hypothetical protein